MYIYYRYIDLFLEKGLEIVSLPRFVYDFSRDMFLILYSIFYSITCVFAFIA